MTYMVYHRFVGLVVGLYVGGVGLVVGEVVGGVGLDVGFHVPNWRLSMLSNDSLSPFVCLC